VEDANVIVHTKTNPHICEKPVDGCRIEGSNLLTPVVADNLWTRSVFAPLMVQRLN
jgi:hypothetical protein